MSFGPISSAIKQRFQFDVPSEFNSLETKKAFLWEQDRREELIKLFPVPGEHYLWLPMCEWLQPAEIRTFEFPDFIQPLSPASQFVPFAQDGSGHHWCWWTKRTDERGSPVVLCAYDSTEGEIHAPNFHSFLFKQAIDYASGFSTNATDEELGECRAILRRLATDLAFLWPSDWAESLVSVANSALKSWKWRHQTHTGLLSIEEHRDLVLKKLEFPLADTSFRWRIE